MQCKQLDRIPNALGGLLRIFCPKCSHYCEGNCKNPRRKAKDDPCPFDKKELPILPGIDDDWLTVE